MFFKKKNKILYLFQIQPRNLNLDLWKPSIFKNSHVVTNDPEWKFNYLNHQEYIKDNWNLKSQNKLWLYNLHYQEDLLSHMPLQIKIKLIEKWISDNPIDQQGNGWEPYPLSLRIVNWVKFFIEHKVCTPLMLKSLSIQAESLFNQIEFHLLGNHLFENAKALIFVGVFFEGENASKWRKKGIKILLTQIREQILDDGGHFERCPMYHGIILEGILDLINLHYTAPTIFPSALKDLLFKKAEDMLVWMDRMVHLDKNISFFNDTTFGVSSNYNQLKNYSEKMGFSPRLVDKKFYFLKDSQFISFKTDNLSLLADFGSISPSYLPGHAHAGTFSFELSLEGHRIFVNRGISTYEKNIMRLDQRGTSSHNTLSINHQSSSQMWGAFRVARRAKVCDIFIEDTPDVTKFKAKHDGFYKDYAVYHHREFTVEKNEITIKDEITRKSNQDIEINFYLHPTCSVLQTQPHVLEIMSLNKKIKMHVDENLLVHIYPSFFHNGYNSYQLTSRILLKGQLSESKKYTNRLLWS